jgi:hypothetical protein
VKYAVDCTALEVEGYLFLCIVFRIFAWWWQDSVVESMSRPGYCLDVESTDELGILCGCGLCVVEITSCGLVYVQCHSIISSCRGTSIDHGGMVQLSAK